jgi:hypothetical protein
MVGRVSGIVFQNDSPMFLNDSKQNMFKYAGAGSGLVFKHSSPIVLNTSKADMVKYKTPDLPTSRESPTTDIIQFVY